MTTKYGGTYNIDSVIGQGSYAKVYLAINPVTGHKIAIKRTRLCATQFVSKNNVPEIHFLRKLAGAPHIIQLHDVFVTEDAAIELALEYMDSDLESYLEKIRSP